VNHLRSLRGLVALLSIVSSPGAATASIIAVSWDSNPYVNSVWAIDAVTAATTPIGVSGAQGLNSLARRSDGALISVSTYFLPGSVVRIDPLTGEASQLVVPQFGASGIDVRALAFSPTDALYALVNVYPSRRNELHLLDLSTGQGFLVADLGVRSIQALEFAPDGTLFGWDIEAGLVRIDPEHGSVTDVSAAFGGGDIQSLAFSFGGILYGAGRSLYRIDVDTGAITLIGSVPVVGSWPGATVRGIAFIPEPAPLVLLLGGALIFALHERAPLGPPPNKASLTTRS